MISNKPNLRVLIIFSFATRHVTCLSHPFREKAPMRSHLLDQQNKTSLDKAGLPAVAVDKDNAKAQTWKVGFYRDMNFH